MVVDGEDWWVVTEASTEMPAARAPSAKQRHATPTQTPISRCRARTHRRSAKTMGTPPLQFGVGPALGRRGPSKRLSDDPARLEAIAPERSATLHHFDHAGKQFSRAGGIDFLEGRISKARRDRTDDHGRR
jgi:hypothetical protein